MNLLRDRDVAERLHVSVCTARRIRARGEILEVRPSPGLVRVTAESVDLYLARRLAPRRAAAAA